MSFLGNISSGNSLGYYWTGAAWAKFGLSDTGNLQITGGSASGSTWTDGAGDLQLKNGLGLDIQSTGTLNVNSGATTLGGNLTVTGITALNGNTNIQADLSVGAGGGVNFSVGGSTGNIATNGSLTVSGNTDIGSNTADTLTISALVDSDIVPSGTTRDIGGSSNNWRDGYFSGTITAGTFSGGLSGNVTTSTGTSSFNNVTVNGTLTATSLTGNADTATDLSINATQQLVIQTGNNATDVFANGTANYILTSGGPSAAPTWEQNFAGTATNADNINIDESNTAANFQILFSNTNQTGYQRPYIDTDDSHFLYNPNTATLSGLNISGSSIQATTFGTASQNAYGARTVSQSDPTGGSNGDIWYKY